jgi:beta-galactosidase
MIVLCYGPKENKDKGYHQGDIIGYNKYFGWYEGKMEDIYPFMKEYHELEPEKPLVLTEYGAGADVRIHSFHPTRFDHSEEYQVEYHQFHLKAIKDTDYLAGATVWNFIDFNSEFRMDAIPHINEKGLVTADRQPKACYYYYKTALSKTPYLSIPWKLWTQRGGMEDSLNSGVCTQPVEVFANVPSVEMFLNGKSLGVKTVDKYCATFRVPFVNGENLLELKSIGSSSPLTDYLRVNFEMQPYALSETKTAFHEMAVNCGSYCFLNNDKQNNFLWLPDKEYTKGSWGYIGGSYYKRNNDILGTPYTIFNTDLNPLFQTKLVGLNAYRFDVPDGEYELTLCWAIYPGENSVFDVNINHQQMIQNLDFKKQYGVCKAVSIRYRVLVSDSKGLQVDFVPKEGKAFLNGVSLRKVN